MSSPKYLSIEVVKPLLRYLLLVGQLLQGGGQRVELALQTVTLGRLQTYLEKTEAENFRNGAGISGNQQYQRQHHCQRQHHGKRRHDCQRQHHCERNQGRFV